VGGCECGAIAFHGFADSHYAVTRYAGSRLTWASFYGFADSPVALSRHPLRGFALSRREITTRLRARQASSTAQ